MNTLPRRSFLKHSAAALAAATLLPAARATSANGFRIFACDWTLRKTCDPDSFELAARIGLDGVQVDFGRLAEGVTTLPLFSEAHQEKILDASAKHRVAIASLALGVLNSVPYKSDPESEFSRLKDLQFYTFSPLPARCRGHTAGRGGSSRRNVHYPQ